MRTSWKIHLGRSSDIMTRRLRPWSSKPRIKRLDRIYLPKTLILGYLVTSHKVCRGLHESLDLSFFIYKNCKISVKLSFSFYNNFIICYMYSLVINVILSVFWYFKLYNPYISIQIYCLRNRNVWTQENCMSPPGHSNIRYTWLATHVYPTLEYQEANLQINWLKYFFSLKS